MGSYSFLSANWKVFAPNYYKLSHPVVQVGFPGFVRSEKNQIAIYNFMRRKMEDLKEYGILEDPLEDKNLRVKRVVDKYRSVAFPPKVKVSSEPADVEE